MSDILEPPKSRAFAKLSVLIGFLAVIAYGLIAFGNDFTLENFARNETRIRAFQQDVPLATFALMFLVYVATTALSLPFATVLTLAYAWLFKMVYGEVDGFLVGVAVVSFASTTGATLSFLLSRYLFRDAVQRRFGDRLGKFDDALENDGPIYLLSLRLTHAIPFFVINLVMGLTPIRVWTFWWVSQLGMLAGTCLFVFVGVQIPSAQDLAKHGVGGVLKTEYFIAFFLLGLFPLVAKQLMGRLRREPIENEN